MKKILLTGALLAGISMTIQAQFIKQGTIIGSGAFSFRNTKNSQSDDKTTTFFLLPWAGYLVADNIVVGAGITYSSDKIKYASTDYVSSNTSTLFGPVVRYYFDQGFFGHGSFAFGGSKSKTEITGTTTTTKFGETSWRLGAGYAVRITDTVLFEPIIGYGGDTTKDKTNDTKSSENGIFIMGSFTIFLHSGN